MIQRIVIDLGKIRTLDGTTLQWEAALPKHYTIERSINGTTFHSALKANGKGSSDTHKIKPAKARFVRINMEKPATQWGYSLYEIEVFGK